MANNKNKNSNKRCFKCNEYGHVERDCFSVQLAKALAMNSGKVEKKRKHKNKNKKPLEERIEM